MTKQELEQLKDKLEQQGERLNLLLAEIKYTQMLVRKICTDYQHGNQTKSKTQD